MTNLTAQDMAAAIRQIEAGSAYLPGLPAQVSIPVTALREAIAALVRWESAPPSHEPHLWGVMYSDNNRVAAHNVYLTKGAALQRAADAAIPAKVVPLYLNAPISLPRLSYLYALLGAEQWIEAGQIWDQNPEEREAAYAEVRAALSSINGGRENG